MIKAIIIKLLFKILKTDIALKKVYTETEIPTMSSPKKDKEALQLSINKHKIALADAADIQDYMKYLRQLVLVYQRLRLRENKSRQKEYLVIIIFLTKHIYELEQSLKRYKKMDSKFIIKVRKDKYKKIIN